MSFSLSWNLIIECIKNLLNSKPCQVCNVDYFEEMVAASLVRNQHKAQPTT